MTRFISYLIDFSLSTIFASNFVTDCLITFEKKKTRFFFEKFSTKHEKDFSPLVCSHRSSGGIEEVSKRLILIDQRSIHDLFSVDKDSVILTSHIQGVQKYGIKFFNTKLTYFQKERIINNYQFIFAMWKCENEYFEKIDKTIEFYSPIFQLF